MCTCQMYLMLPVYMSNVPHVYLSNVPHVLHVKCTSRVVIWHVHIIGTFDMLTWGIFDMFTWGHFHMRCRICQLYKLLYMFMPSTVMSWSAHVFIICKCTMYSCSCTNLCQVFLMCICICLMYCRSIKAYVHLIVPHITLWYTCTARVLSTVLFPNWSSKVYSPEKITIPNLA